MSGDGSNGRPATTPDPFAGAKANLRDTIKWLTTTFAAVVAAVLAGSPLTGLGGMPFTWRFVLAVVAALAGMGCLLLAIVRTLGLLRSEAFFLDTARNDQRLLEIVDQNAVDLLPPQYSSALDFLDQRKKLREAINSESDTNSQQYKEHLALYEAFDLVSARITSFLHFEYLALRLKEEARLLVPLAIGAVAGLGVFAWAANPPKAAIVAPSCCGTPCTPSAHPPA